MQLNIDLIKWDIPSFWQYVEGGKIVNFFLYWDFYTFLYLEHGHGHSHRRAHHRSLPTIEEVLAEEDINENHENYRLSDNLPNTTQDTHGNHQMG